MRYYRLRLTFQDGTVGDVDFSRREWRGVFEPLRDLSYFARVSVDAEAGTIAWPDGLDLAPERCTPRPGATPSKQRAPRPEAAGERGARFAQCLVRPRRRKTAGRSWNEGGACRDRTGDLRLAKPTLSQLS
jgi:uncharacterized protein DUF2442